MVDLKFKSRFPNSIVLHFISLRKVCSYDPLYFSSISCSFSFFIFNIIFLSPFPFFLRSLVKGFLFILLGILLSILLSSQTFRFIDLCYCLHQFYFVFSALILMVSFLLPKDFVCSSFFSCFRCKFRLFI